jgi:hypothetical protein
METIIVGFSTHKKFGIFPWLIKKVEKTPYSHVYLKFYSSKLDRDVIYQASGTKVNFVGTEIFNRDSVVIEEFSIDISDEVKTKTMRFCIDNAGIAYGMKQVLGIGIVRFFRLFNKEIKNPFSDGYKTEVCAELVGHILEDCLGNKLDIDLDTVGPKGIYDYVSKIKADQK